MRKALLPGVLALSLAASSAFVATAAAQSPPIPPARFAGTVSIDGAPAPGGTPIEARVGSASCGTTEVFIEGGASRYVLDVAAESTSTPGCGTDGATVSFFVAGQAAGSGSWVNFDLNQLNLGSSAATPTPTASPTSTATGTATAPPSTPRAPQTGSGQDASGEGMSPLETAAGAAMVLGAAALAVEGGRRLARRRA